MTQNETELWRNLILTRCGTHFTDGRLYFMQQRLWERMQTKGFQSYTDYYHFVTFNASGSSEWLALRDMILNNESSFFRHKPSYDALINTVLPELVSRRRLAGNNSLMLWSAGCSGGQEAYSLAMSLLEVIDPFLWQIKVSGSDISQDQLMKAQAGRYKAYEVRYMPAYYRSRYMTEVKSGPDTYFQVNRNVRALTHFGTLNLHDPNNYWIAGQDVIFCQNVLIYFRLADRVEVVKRLSQRLNRGGYLFLGPAEVVGLHLPGLELIRWRDVLVYKRVE